MSIMLALIACTFTFVACGDDDDDEANDGSSITGIWEYKYWEYGGRRINIEDFFRNEGGLEESPVWKLHLNADGSALFEASGGLLPGYTTRYPGSWRLESDILTIRFSTYPDGGDGYPEIARWRVVRYTSGELVVRTLTDDGLDEDVQEDFILEPGCDNIWVKVK